MSFKKEDLFDALKTLVLPELSKLQATTDRLDTRLSNVEGHLEQIDKRFDQPPTRRMMYGRIIRAERTQAFEMIILPSIILQNVNACDPT